MVTAINSCCDKWVFLHHERPINIVTLSDRTFTEWIIKSGIVPLKITAAPINAVEVLIFTICDRIFKLVILSYCALALFVILFVTNCGCLSIIVIVVIFSNSHCFSRFLIFVLHIVVYLNIVLHLSRISIQIMSLLSWCFLYLMNNDGSGILRWSCWVQVFHRLIHFINPLQAPKMRHHTLRCLLHFRGIHSRCIIRLPRSELFNISIENRHLAIADHLVIRAFFGTFGCGWIQAFDLTLSHVSFMFSQQSVSKVYSFALFLNLVWVDTISWILITTIVVIIHDRCSQCRLNHYFICWGVNISCRMH